MWKEGIVHHAKPWLCAFTSNSTRITWECAMAGKHDIETHVVLKNCTDSRIYSDI